MSTIVEQYAETHGITLPAPRSGKIKKAKLTKERKHEIAMMGAEASKIARAARVVKKGRHARRGRPPVHVLGGGEGPLMEAFKLAWRALWRETGMPAEHTVLGGMIAQAAVDKARLDIVTQEYGEAHRLRRAGAEGAPTQAEVDALASQREAARDRWDADLAAFRGIKETDERRAESAYKRRLAESRH